MYSNDKNIIIVFNGEIYNYIELREELKILGHRFNTNSDTEVIIHAYEEWGIDSQKKLNGMWAFAIWDENKRTLLLSRDRIGEKPLHYAVFNNTFLFSSEIKSILEAGSRRELDLLSFNKYLVFQYVPYPNTMFRDIYKVPPGSHLIYNSNGIEITRYWKPSIDSSYLASNPIPQFYRLLRDSVRLRLVSDVPVGVFLSGGIDSSSIAATMQELSEEPIQNLGDGIIAYIMLCN